MRKLVLILFVLICPIAGWSADLPRYALILSDPAPVRARAQGGPAAVEAARIKVLAAQAAVRSELNARGIRITGASHTLLNAVFVAADPSVVAQLTSIAGVIQVARLGRFRPTLDHAVQLINVPAAYSLIGGASNAGAGIKIGMIDSGITATHPAFRGFLTRCLPAGFPICTVTFASGPGRLCDVATDAGIGFPLCASLLNCDYVNNKVIVGQKLCAGSQQRGRSDFDAGRHFTARPRGPRNGNGDGSGGRHQHRALRHDQLGIAPKAFLGSYRRIRIAGREPLSRVAMPSLRPSTTPSTTAWISPLCHWAVRP